MRKLILLPVWALLLLSQSVFATDTTVKDNVAAPSATPAVKSIKNGDLKKSKHHSTKVVTESTTVVTKKETETVKTVVSVRPVVTEREPALRLLRGSLMSVDFDVWAKKIGWTLIWDSKVNYINPVDTSFTGSVEEISSKFENSAIHNRLPLHIEGHRANTTIQVTD